MSVPVCPQTSRLKTKLGDAINRDPHVQVGCSRLVAEQSAGSHAHAAEG